MKHFFTLMLFCSFSLLAFGQNMLEKILSASDAGVPFENLYNVRELDDRYLHILSREDTDIDNGAFTDQPFIYDLVQKKILLYTFDSANGEFFRPSSYVQEMGWIIGKEEENKPFFAYHKSKIYYISGQRVIVYDLQTEQRKVFPMQISGFVLLTPFEHQDELYLAVACNDFKLFKLNDTALTTVFETEVYRNTYVRPLLINTVPVYINGKLVLNEVNQIRAYDFEREVLDTLLTMTDILQPIEYAGFGDFSTTMLTQVLPHDGYLYLVVKDAVFAHGRIEDWFAAFHTKARVIRTDGTLAGTQRLFDHVLNFPFANFFPIKNTEMLVAAEDKLYWIEIDDATTKYQLFQVDASVLTPVAEVPLGPEENIAFINNKFVTYLYDNATNTSGFLSFYSVSQSGSEEVKNECYLWSLKDGQLVQEIGGNNLYDWTDEYGEVRFFPLNQEAGLLVSYTYEPKTVFSLLNLAEQTLTPLDSIAEFPIEFSHSGFMDKDLFFVAQKSFLGEGSIWKFSLNTAASIGNPMSAVKDLFSVFPNPSAFEVNISFEEAENGSVTLLGMDGKVYQSYPVAGKELKMDVSNLSDGMYIALFRSSSKTGFRQFLIQH